MKRNKILFPFVGDTLGGSHLSALSLIDSLPKERFEPIVMVYKRGRLTEYLDQQDYEYRVMKNKTFVGNVSFISKVFLFFASFFDSFFFIKKNGVELVHTNDLRMHYSWVFACLFSGVPHVWHQRSESPRGVILSFFSKRLLTITEFCKSGFPPLVRGKAIVVDDPVTTEGNKKVKCSLDASYMKVSWVGNLISQKRLDVAIRIISKLKEITPNIELHIFGEKREPVYAEMCSLVSELKLSENVKFMGVKAPINEWLSETDVLLATAENEGMGRALIEAMLLGLPVVASDHGGHKEVIQHNVSGVLVPLENIDGYVDAILKLVKDADLRKCIVESAISYANEKYSCEKHAGSIVNIYNEVLSETSENVR
ncbi:glycosyltransferase family 4 protein [Oceanimonas sp. MB9]|uniref:glycosyltransferase family 4 protein n=1 Tax=Oceanimonas sp. MB9 TaxID=2588453 RepID=UPI0013F60EA6|nr:glycosyltransferase family 4 protein [Oceanimonas sp. MB9]NHI01398.1 N-acetyl-alpha-D-glucosaminyl L-malate synthase [Oceanimonas sp. MB9]